MNILGNIINQTQFKLDGPPVIMIVFHWEMLFSKSAIIYKEIPKNRNFRLTSFGKKIINQKILKRVTQKLVKRWAIG